MVAKACLSLTFLPASGVSILEDSLGNRIKAVVPVVVIIVLDGTSALGIHLSCLLVELMDWPVPHSKSLTAIEEPHVDAYLGYRKR